MKKILEKLVLLFLDISGINMLFSLFNQDKAIILCYHGICDKPFNLLKDYDQRHIPKLLFEKQLRYLKRKGYSFVTLSELMDIFEHKKKSENWLSSLLTTDSEVLWKMPIRL